MAYTAPWFNYSKMHQTLPSLGQSRSHRTYHAKAGLLWFIIQQEVPDHVQICYTNECVYSTYYNYENTQPTYFMFTRKQLCSKNVYTCQGYFFYAFIKCHVGLSRNRQLHWVRSSAARWRRYPSSSLVICLCIVFTKPSSFCLIFQSFKTPDMNNTSGLPVFMLIYFMMDGDDLFSLIGTHSWLPWSYRFFVFFSGQLR